MTNYPRISLCMIARDEAELLPQAINSVKSIISEVIIVDTGSKDSTKEVAKHLGALVLERPWDDDFSAPRNLSIEHATGDWIFVLDADEAIAESDLKLLQQHTLEPNTCWEFMQRHYSEDHRLSEFQPCRQEYPEWERQYGGYFESNLCRLFPNHCGLHYQGRVHELVEHSIYSLGQHKIVRSPIPIHHYGHTPETKERKNKSKLYTPLGERKVTEEPTSWKSHFEIAVEHNCNGRRAESAKAFEQALKMNPHYVPAWINYGYVLCELGRLPAAAQILQEALRREPGSAEAHCNLGVVYLRARQLPAAEANFIAAINSRPNYINALCNLSQVYIQQNRFQEAARILQQVIQLHPHNAIAKTDLGGILVQFNKFDQARPLLEQAIQEDPKLSRAHFYLGQIYRFQNRTKEAVNALRRFCDLEQQQPPSPDHAKFIQEVLQTCEQLERP